MTEVFKKQFGCLGRANTEKPADENLVAVSIVTVRLRYERYYAELQPSSVLYFEEATPGALTTNCEPH